MLVHVELAVQQDAVRNNIKGLTEIKNDYSHHLMKSEFLDVFLSGLEFLMNPVMC